MDNEHLLNAARNVSLNPVRARLVKAAADWPWSSARVHLAGTDDHVVKVAPVLERTGDFARVVDQPFDDNETYGALRRGETIGRPVGGGGSALGRFGGLVNRHRNSIVFCIQCAPHSGPAER